MILPTIAFKPSTPIAKPTRLAAIIIKMFPLEVDIVPERDESKDSEEVANGAHFALSTATNGNVDISDDPAVETPVPATPEGQCRVVVAHAANHVFRRIDAIHE
ncbi:hypothetical protein KCV07_g140, partial [Aureobasidium melanogenum]